MIGFKALRAVVAELHGEGASPGALLARFKYFQRMGFPGGSNVGRGSRADYGLGEVLALALAFELQETSVTPVRVVRLLRAEWPAIGRAIASTWMALERRVGQPLILAHAPGALAELGCAENESVPASDPLVVIARDAVGEWLETSDALASPALYLIDLSRFVKQVASALVAVGGVEADDLRERFDLFGEEMFGSSGRSDWFVEVERLVGSRDRSGPAIEVPRANG